MNRRRLAIAVVCAAAAFAGFTFFRASSALRDAESAVRSASQLPVESGPLNRTIPAGFELIAAPPTYAAAVTFEGRLAQAADSGLYIDGLPSYRTGFELPPAPLTALALAPPGLWIATSGAGLLAFDGAHFRQVRPTQPELRQVTALLATRSGAIIFGTAKAGMYRWDERNLAPLHESLTGIPITALAGSEEDLWIGTLDRGVIHFHAGQSERIGEAEGLPDRQVQSIATRAASAFIGTSMGVAEIRDGRFHRVLAPGVFAKSLALEGAKLVIGTIGDGSLELDLDAQRGRPAVRPRATAAQPIGATAASNIAALAVSPEGNIWIGYFDRGLEILDPALRRIARLEDDQLFCVNRIVHTPTQTAVATAAGLVLLDAQGRKRQTLTKRDGLIANHVTDVNATATGFAIATPAGITLTQPGGPQSLYAFHGLVNNHVYALGQQGPRLLAGTLGGLSILESGIVRASYTTANSALRHNWITAITALNNDAYIGTYGDGVYRLDDRNVWQSATDSEKDIVINPNAIAAAEGLVFAGTLDRGLAIYDTQNRRRREIQNGLPSLNVTALAIRGGIIYIGTDRGLVRVKLSLFN